MHSLVGTAPNASLTESAKYHTKEQSHAHRGENKIYIKPLH